MKRLAALAASLLLTVSCGYRPSSPLARAAFDGSLDTVKKLAPQASVTDRNEALIAAARSGHGAVILALIQAGTDPNLRSGVNGWSALQHASHKNHVESVQALIAGGADVNAVDAHHRTVLMMAAGYGQLDIVKALLAAKADARIEDEDKNTALDWSITGTTDVDDFTLGQCKPDVAAALLDAAPELASSPKYWHGIATKASRCQDVDNLIRTRRAALQNKPRS